MADSDTGTAIPTTGPLTIRQAADAITEQRVKDQEQAAVPRAPDGKFAPREPAPPEEPENLAPTSQEADAAPLEAEAPGETEATEPADEQPSLEPPRSWTQEEKEAFHNLSPEHQKIMLDRETKRDKDIRTRLNEVAEKEKRAQADAQALQQAKQKYEQALPQLVNALQASHMEKFGDIRSQADLDRLAKEDWPRWIEFQNSRQKVQVESARLAQAQQAAALEQSRKWQAWAAEQDDKFVKDHPEFADKDKARSLIDRSKAYLNDLGFTDDELKTMLTGSIMRDARWQRMVYEATKYRTAQAELKKSAEAPKSVPKVQRPGTPRAAQDARNAQLQNLNKRLDTTTGQKQLRVAAELLAARRAASR